MTRHTTLTAEAPAPAWKPLSDIIAQVRRLGEADKIRLIDAIAAEMDDPDLLTEALQEAARVYAHSLSGDADEADAYADSIIPQSRGCNPDIWKRHAITRDSQLNHALSYRVGRAA